MSSDKITFSFPAEIKSDATGFEVFINFYNTIKDSEFSTIILDFKVTTWFEANLTAVLGAILSQTKDNSNNVQIVNLNPRIQELFERNQFLSHFGGYSIHDYYATTVKYQKFRIKEERLFKNYLDYELLSRDAMPSMSTQLRKKINESIFEIFNNAVIHGQCKYVFSCGQYYPNKKILDFTIVDLGNTIKSNVNAFLKTTFTGEEAIRWAIEENHTTKSGSIPGGLGLSLIRAFLDKNEGKMQIVSSDGFLEETNRTKKSINYKKSFQGTIVNLEFNINDKSYHYLSSEIDAENIF